jgi:hypothetical protein
MAAAAGIDEILTLRDGALRLLAVSGGKALIRLENPNTDLAPIWHRFRTDVAPLSGSGAAGAAGHTSVGAGRGAPAALVPALPAERAGDAERRRQRLGHAERGRRAAGPQLNRRSRAAVTGRAAMACGRSNRRAPDRLPTVRGPGAGDRLGGGLRLLPACPFRQPAGACASAASRRRGPRSGGSARARRRISPTALPASPPDRPAGAG